MERPTTVWLMRHGQVHNPRGILYGRLPRFRLSAAGREEARSTARLLAGRPLAALYSSPLLRARQTAREVLALHPGLHLALDRCLNEVLSAFQGQPGSLVDARRGDIYSDAEAPCEQPRDLLRRLRAFFRKARRRHPGREVLAVTHGDPILFAILWAAGLPPTPAAKADLRGCGCTTGYPATASLTGFRFHSTEAGEVPALCTLAAGRVALLCPPRALREPLLPAG
jgi:broad specificity phosphatase PhoE